MQISIRGAETNFLDSFFSKIILVATFFSIIVTPAGSLFPIIKKIKKAGTLSGRERKRKNSRQGNWRNSRCVYVCACVRALYGTWRPISLAQRRGFFFLSASACDFRREKENVTGTHAPRIDAPSCPWKVPITRGLLHGFWHLEQARSAWQPVAEPATFSPLLLSILIESKRHDHGFPSNQTCILVSTGLVESSFPLPQSGGKIRGFVVVKLRTEHCPCKVIPFGKPDFENGFQEMLNLQRNSFKLFDDSSF